MDFLDRIAEQRIADAVQAGAFDDLPGAGRPLDLGDDLLVPEELRAAYRILRNAGYLPPEVEARREAANLRALLAAAAGDGPDDPVRRRALARLALIEFALEAKGRSLRASGYGASVVARFAGEKPGP
jgi:hypothetical protein